MTEPTQAAEPDASNSRHKLWHVIGTVLTLVLVGLGSLYFETIKDYFPFFITWQLKGYDLISHWEARTPRTKWVVGVEIDNPTFYDRLKLTGQNDITDRGFLADIIDKAVMANAAVIALDINLVRNNDDEKNPYRMQQNQALFDAIYRAEQKHIPVVLAFGFVDPANGKPLQNICDTRPQVPMCLDPTTAGGGDHPNLRVGFDHGAEDRRKVPLCIHRMGDGQSFEYSSFALQAADAYETLIGIQKRTRERLQNRIRKGQFVYTAFLPRRDFAHLSASDVCDGTANNALNHRIVLIGGNRTKWPVTDGTKLDLDSPDPKMLDSMLDYHAGPAGAMAGMYFHANFIEGLLDDRIKSPIPPWVAVVVDVLLAIFMMVLVWRLGRRGVGLLAQLAVLVGVFAALFLAYVASANFGYCLDCVAMLVILFAHTFFEHYWHLQERAHSQTNPSRGAKHKELVC